MLDFKTNFTNSEKNKFANQYKNLVVKLVKQTVDKGFSDWDQIESAAWEGFALAMENYDETRSKLNFTQYAAWSIRNRILYSLDEELRTVKVSYYQRKKAEGKNEPIYSRIGFDKNNNNEDNDSSDSFKKFNLEGMHSNPTFADGDIYEYMYTRLNKRFPKNQCEMFYRSFGLNGFDEMKGKDIAKEYGVSEGLVSQKVKKIVTWMKSDNEMCEMLGNLIN